MSFIDTISKELSVPKILIERKVSALETKLGMKFENLSIKDKSDFISLIKSESSTGKKKSGIESFLESQESVDSFISKSLKEMESGDISKVTDAPGNPRKTDDEDDLLEAEDKKDTEEMTPEEKEKKDKEDEDKKDDSKEDDKKDDKKEEKK